MGVIRRLGRWAARLILVGAVVWGVTVLAVLWASDRMLARHGAPATVARPVDAAMVLGGGSDPDGVIAYSSRRRVAAAVQMLKAGKAGALIMAGGPTRGWENSSLAAGMRAHARSLGVPADRLLVEGRSATTFENLRFAFAIAEDRGMERLALVTDAYHLSRAQALARYFGRPAIELIAARGLAHARLDERIRAVLREAVAWWYNLGKVAAWEALGALGWSVAERAAIVR